MVVHQGGIYALYMVIVRPFQVSSIGKIKYKPILLEKYRATPQRRFKYKVSLPLTLVFDKRNVAFVL